MTKTNLKRVTKTIEEGSPKKMRRSQQEDAKSPAEEKPNTKSEKKTGEADPPQAGKSKAAAAAAKKKEDIKKAQEVEEKKRKRLEDPQERCKNFLNQVPRALADLAMASTELKSKKIKDNVKPNFVKEYQSEVDQHVKKLLDSRNHCERSACKDAKLFARRVSGEYLTAAENELCSAKKTLKSWRNCVHVWLNDTEKSKSKAGSSSGGGAV